MAVPRIVLFEEWLKSKKEDRQCTLLNLILSKIGKDVDYTKLKLKVKNLCCEINLRWVQSHRTKARFLKYHSNWLSQPQHFSDCVLDVGPSTIHKSSNNKGRPKLEFSESSLRSKKRKAKELRDDTNTEQLVMAAEMELRSSGKRNSAQILYELSTTSPSMGTTLKKSLIFKETAKSLLPDHALAMIIDTNLSTHEYNLLRQYSSEVNPKLYPSYNCVKKSKIQCYPENITVTETHAEIELQSLIDHSIKRLCAAQEEVLLSIPEVKELNFLIKWGCDGAEQSNYKQQFCEENQLDSTMFFISMVLLQLYANVNGRKIIIWNNPAPSSTRYCRPITFMFAKETRDLIVSEVKRIQDQISMLQPTQINMDKLNFAVNSKLVLCMIDGKVCNALSSYTSSQVCYICGASPKSMNSVSALAKYNVDESMLTFGISPLHSWIRCMECMLHIAYRINIKIWSVRGAQNKEEVKMRREYIQNRFKAEVGLLIDMPKQKTGNSNDGNTARRFFQDPEKTSSITGINADLLKKFHTILCCISCGYSININAFETFIAETRELYLAEYPWYFMPVTVHKILFHGKDIIESSILPIGQLSEEAQESRNKDTRNYRECFTRKTSRVATNTDLLNRLLISSDPYICSLRKKPLTKKRAINPELVALLAGPEIVEDIDSE